MKKILVILTFLVPMQILSAHFDATKLDGKLIITSTGLEPINIPRSNSQLLENISNVFRFIRVHNAPHRILYRVVNYTRALDRTGYVFFAEHLYDLMTWKGASNAPFRASLIEFFPARKAGDHSFIRLISPWNALHQDHYVKFEDNYARWEFEGADVPSVNYLYLAPPKMIELLVERQDMHNIITGFEREHPRVDASRCEKHMH